MRYHRISQNLMERAEVALSDGLALAIAVQGLLDSGAIGPEWVGGLPDMTKAVLDAREVHTELTVIEGQADIAESN